jgi:hypothetical protein
MCSLSNIINQNLNLQFHQMAFLFEFLNIHMNEQVTTYHDCHGFKWKNINISLILIGSISDIDNFFGSLNCDQTFLEIKTFHKLVKCEFYDGNWTNLIYWKRQPLKHLFNTHVIKKNPNQKWSNWTMNFWRKGH